MRKVAIIGAGFTGLSAAIRLTDNGVTPTVFEASKSLGGLAGSFKSKSWDWSLENYYHHIFTNDRDIIAMAEKVGRPPIFREPLTTSYIKGGELQLDSPISVLRFTELSIVSRLWMGAGLLALKLLPDGLYLEKFRVVDLLPKLVGKCGYKIIWERLLKAKFGPFVNEVNMAWFWTRVAKRTKQLGYFNGGFSSLLEAMAGYVIDKGGSIKMGESVGKIEQIDDKWIVNDEVFDKVIVTVPMPKIDTIVPSLKEKIPKLDYLWSQTLILELKRGLIKGYWMNILEDNWPFLVAVEQTNMIDKKNYGGSVLLYLGNYLPEGDIKLKMDKDQLLEHFLPYLRKISPDFSKEDIIQSWSFKSPFAQPVFPTNYSNIMPKMSDGEKGLFVANMSMVYPFDRGTNYAVKMGNDVADLILKEI